MEFSAQMIAQHLNGTIEGNPNEIVSDISKIEEGKPGTLSFLANPKYENYIYTCESSIILVNNDFQAKKEIKATLIRVPNAYEAFASLLDMYQKNAPEKTGVDKKVVIDETAMIGENCYIGAFTVISKNAFIGNNVKIYPQVFIDEDVVIEDNTILYSGVKIYKECKIGKNCIIHSSAVIGSDGFGFAPQEDGSYKKIPQLGNVILEDDVEIGSNTSIDRSTMGSTILRKGVKLDNLIQVAHNVEIGTDTVIAAQTGIAGSTKVGKRCMIGGQVGIVGHITVGDEVKVTAKSGVLSKAKDGETLFGNPAIDFMRAKKVFVSQRHVPEMYRQFKEIEKELADIKAKLNSNG